MKRKYIPNFFRASLLYAIYIILSKTNIMAQAPLAIPYQAVARNISGNIIPNQTISLRFSIHDATVTGTIVYQETQSVITNTLGLFIVNIGQGTPMIGTLIGVNWSNGAKFIQVELDATGGNSFVNMGTTQLMSVPYALYSAKGGNLPDGSANGNTIRWNGTSWIADNSIYNNGINVGIGTANPTTKLEVSGQVKITGGAPGIGKVLTSDANGLASWSQPALGENAKAKITYQVSAGISGGAAVAVNSWVTRPLNTIKYDDIGITLNNNTINLPSGTYEVSTKCLFNNSNVSGLGYAKTRIRRVSPSSVLAISLNSSLGGTNSISSYVSSINNERFTLTTGADIQLEYYINSTNGNGSTTLGAPFFSPSQDELYVEVFITKIRQ